MNQKTALAIIIALFIVFVLAYISYGAYQMSPNGMTASSTAAMEDGTQVSLQGQYICLPLRDQSAASSTLDCTLGIETPNGVYYAIDATGDAAKNTLLSLQTGVSVQIDGVLVPTDEISADVFQKYDIGGVVSTNNIMQIASSSQM